MNYETIKQLAKETGQRVTDLIALAPQNDPFYTGTPGDWTLAQWFADLWQQFGYTSGVHIRRVHYQIVSQQPPVIMPNGLPYENTEACWDVLNQASKQARYLGLVDPGAFVDRRNPSPHLFTGEAASTPAINIDPGLWGTPTLPSFPELPRCWVDGYTGQQRYHLEIWCEKSTMNDVLLPLCERYGANLVTGLGEMSITATLALAQRFNGKPVRIFYVSDFDPAGQSMPCAVARKIEYFQRNGGYEADVKLFSVVLTADQVQRYQLPRTPLKKTEKRAGKFEDRHGSGAVELDALEALYPGRLASILTAELDRYYDRGLEQRVWSARNKLNTDLYQQRQAILDDYSAEIDELQTEYEQLRGEFEAKFGGYSQRLTALWQAITDDLKQQAPDITDYPIPDAVQGNERSNALYASERGYIDQLTAYRAYQGKGDAD